MFAARGAAGLVAVDVSDLSQPVEIGRAVPVTAFTAVAVCGRTLVALNDDAGLAVLDAGLGFSPRHGRAPAIAGVASRD